MAEKKVVITNQEWCDLMNRIHRGNYCLTQEAQKLEISLKELIAIGDEAHKGGGNERWQEWTRTKRESAKRDKKMQPRKRKPATTSVPAPTSAPTPAPAPVPAPATPSDPMEELLCKRDKLQKEVISCAASLEEANAILEIRQASLEDAEAVLKKAEAAVQQAQSDVDEAERTLQEAQELQVKTQKELQRVEEEIQKNQVYLVAPWFSGNLPTFGTFLSTVEMEGVKVFEPAETIEPNFKDMVSSGFDLVSEYTRALSFVSLVQEYILEGKEIRVLNTDQRVKKLLDKHIGWSSFDPFAIMQGADTANNCVCPFA